jgi:hypothetical protein
MGLSNAERQARWRAKRDAEIERLRKAAGKAAPATSREVERLTQELEQAKARIGQMAEEQTAQTQRFRDALKRRADKPKAERPPLDPDSAAAREIKSLKTRIKNLQSELAYIKGHYKAQSAAKHGLMTFEAASLIAKALHPDSTPSHAVREEAFKAFTAWKSDKGAARRR